MNVPVIPVGFMLLAALAFGATLVIGVLYFVWCCLYAIVSVLWQAWVRR